MNLKHAIFFYPSMERGGVTVNIKHLINYLTNNNIKVTLISSKIDKKGPGFQKKNFIFLRVNPFLKLFFLPYRWLIAFYSIKNLIKSFSLYKKENTVVLSMQSSMVAIIICKFYGIKVVARNSEDPLSSTVYADNYFLAFIVFIMRFFIYNFANGILTNSLGSKKSLELFILNKNKVKTIYNPYLLKIKKIKKIKKKNIILSVGRLCKQKDFETLILGFSIFIKKFPNYKLVILGDGPDKIKLENLIKNLKLEKKIFLKGWIKNTEKYFSSAKVFALTSLYEGLGNVYIDAINFEIPCVYTNCKSGPDEILLNGKGGYKVKIRDKHDLNFKLEKCVLNYKLSQDKARKAKKKIGRFYYRTTCPRYLNYLEEISLK